MTTREKALKAIQELPEDTSIADIIRELSFLAGVEQAQGEIARGEGMTASQAKTELREWISK